MPLKILQTINSLDARTGGTAEVAVQFAHALGELGHSVTTATTSDVAAPGRNVINLGRAYTSYGYSQRFSRWIDLNIDTFDVAIVHGLWQFFGVATYYACRRIKKPYVIFPHGMLDPWSKIEYPTKYLKKWIYWKLFE